MREVAATLWLMLLGAGLLATSAPNDGVPIDGSDPEGASVSWSGAGPAVTLSDAEPVRAFTVTLMVPKIDQSKWRPFGVASVSLSVSATYANPSPTAGSNGQAGAAPASESEREQPPWLTVLLHDVDGAPLTASGPFIATWSGSADVEFAGDCILPDPDGPDPCRLSFGVEFERDRSDTLAKTTISWDVQVWAMVPEADPDADLEWTAEIEPL